MKQRKKTRPRRREAHKPVRPMGQTIDESYRDPAEGPRETARACPACGAETLVEESVSCPTCGKTSA